MASINDVAPGLYRIYNRYNTAKCLDVDKAATANRALVYGHAPNYSDAQVWELSYRADGTAQLLFRFAGKSLEVYGATPATVAPGQQLSIFNDNDTYAQQWNLIPAGTTATVDGVTYAAYAIQLGGDDVAGNYNAAIDTSVSTYPVKLASPDNTQAKQNWVFVPIEKYRDGGLYEIHSIMDTSMLFDVNGLSKANGANLQLHVPNGGNNQKFVLEKGTGTYAGYWALRSVFSGKYMHTASSTMKNGLNVHQWETTATNNAWWKITEYGTKAINGVSCQVVSFGNKNNTNYLLDAQGALTTNSTNIMVNTNNQGANQEWALLPTSATDANLPTPYGIGLAEKVGGAWSTKAVRAETLYPSWACADGWMRGANHYQIQTRKRYYLSTLGAWGEWEDWSAWETAAVTVDGSRVWLTSGIGATYDVDDALSMQVGIRVRCCGAEEDGLSNLVGGTAEVTADVLFKPTITITDLGWSADGLHVEFESDYPAANKIYIIKTTTTDAAGTTTTSELDVSHTSQDGAGSFVIPAGDLSAWPGDGTSATLMFSVGTNLWARFGGTEEQAGEVTYDAGSGVAVEPVITMGEGRVALATVPHLGDDRMWLQLADGTLLELDGETSGSETTFRVPFPFGAGFVLWTSCQSEDGDSWGTDYSSFAATDEPMASAKPAHSFVWDSGAVCIELKGKSSETDTTRSMTPEFDTYSFNGRERQTVMFGSVVKSQFSADGILVDGVSEASAADFEKKLLSAQHVIYRSPNGHVVRAAVTGVQTTYTPYRTKVSVDLVEEQW